jgi:hypothetical protein
VGVPSINFMMSWLLVPESELPVPLFLEADSQKAPATIAIRRSEVHDMINWVRRVGPEVGCGAVAAAWEVGTDAAGGVKTGAGPD